MPLYDSKIHLISQVYCPNKSNCIQLLEGKCQYFHYPEEIKNNINSITVQHKDLERKFSKYKKNYKIFIESISRIISNSQFYINYADSVPSHIFNMFDVSNISQNDQKNIQNDFRKIIEQPYIVTALNNHSKGIKMTYQHEKIITDFCNYIYWKKLYKIYKI